ncbi:anti-phage dCTP deaminase [Stenotrophomonas acidaminiphila]|uniref:anti-phage dCTP deaminase n=1 Tax=Stenotrophomonas acidaminiphila TaxID=128780 RepID=UPI003BEFFA24
MSAQPTAVVAELRDSPASNELRQVDSTKEVRGSLTPEIVIALCGPIGSPLHEVATQISSALVPFDYKTEQIRLSSIISLNAGDVGKIIFPKPRLKQINSLIEAGDALREKYGHDILAKVAIAKISGDRAQGYGEFDDKAAESGVAESKKINNQRICHIINSIKNESELELLRLVYGNALVAIGVFSPLDIRRHNLQNAAQEAMSSDDIDTLIDTDSGEEFAHGQSVRDTFPRCDFFLRVDQPVSGSTESDAAGQIAKKLRRLFGLIFRTSISTPLPEETAMYAAASAARNSACLSRQVGASVTSRSGELLAVGWNDVPQAGGGLYGKPSLEATSAALDPSADRRCFAGENPRCRNDEEKLGIAGKVADLLIKEGLVAKDHRDRILTAISKDSRVKDLIEFSRAVHAEMHAILGAGRIAGDRLVGGMIFVTTYPCHSCARHIVAAGITEIHYIEPYRKSMATKLHSDSLTEGVGPDMRVKLIQFDGVAPRRFIEIFEAGKRKDRGVLDLSLRDAAIPSTRVSLKAIPRLEEAVIAELENKTLKYVPLAST